MLIYTILVIATPAPLPYTLQEQDVIGKWTYQFKFSKTSNDGLGTIAFYPDHTYYCQFSRHIRYFGTWSLKNHVLELNEITAFIDDQGREEKTPPEKVTATFDPAWKKPKILAASQIKKSLTTYFKITR